MTSLPQYLLGQTFLLRMRSSILTVIIIIVIMTIRIITAVAKIQPQGDSNEKRKKEARHSGTDNYY